MTSAQVMPPGARLRRWALRGALTTLAVLLTACFYTRPADPLTSPYPTRHVWAVAPLANESGSLYADGLRMADHLQQQLEQASNLDVVPVNRVLAAMQALKLQQITTQAQARQLRQVLGVDGLVIGTMTAYDPYDPPKVGLALELYTAADVENFDAREIRNLSMQPVDTAPRAGDTATDRNSPTVVVSDVLDASDPRTRAALEKFATQRGPQKEAEAWRRYRVSIDLYSEFVAYAMSRRLLQAERDRLYPPPPSAQTQPDSPPVDLTPITEPIMERVQRIVE